MRPPAKTPDLPTINSGMAAASGVGTSGSAGTAAGIRVGAPAGSGGASAGAHGARSGAAAPLPTRLLSFGAVPPFRAWREELMAQCTSVGFVPTMGALHEGHMSLVDASMLENEYTVVSIFVNPAQFAPHEDLASYPRTLETDLRVLEERDAGRGTVVVLVPQVRDMYPNGFTQEVDKQVGAFVEVKGLSHQMEGRTRPIFFRGVATVVTKLFNIVLPHRAYFGQKDIQQTIVLRRLVSDLLFTYPCGAENVRVVPTARDPSDQLALSSRNAYLDARGRAVAPVLFAALERGRSVWEQLLERGVEPAERIHATLQAARSVVEAAAQPQAGGASVQLDYVALNDPDTLEDMDQASYEPVGGARAAILSGAMWVRNDAAEEQPAARLIDNVLLGYTLG